VSQGGATPLAPTIYGYSQPLRDYGPEAVRDGRVLTVPDRHGKPVRVLAIDTDGGVGVNYIHMCGHSPYGDANERLALNRRLNEIDGISIDDDYVERCSWPKVRLDALRSPAVRTAFFRVFDDVAKRLSGSSS
jgi:hypothetical protein